MNRFNFAAVATLAALVAASPAYALEPVKISFVVPTVQCGAMLVGFGKREIDDGERLRAETRVGTLGEQVDSELRRCADQLVAQQPGI